MGQLQQFLEKWLYVCAVASFFVQDIAYKVGKACLGISSLTLNQSLHDSAKRLLIFGLGIKVDKAFQ